MNRTSNMTISFQKGDFRHRSLIFLTALILACIGMGTHAPGQEAVSGTTETVTVEEILVTARKKEESLQEVPIAVAAFTGEDLKRKGLLDVVDVGSFIPNVKLEAGTTDVGGAANATFFIRGIGQLDYAPTIDPGVGLYVDGVYFGRSVGSVLELTDTERVEILKGPQGTLFGKNTMGGAINITTQRPDPDKASGSLSLTGGEDARFNLDMNLNVPITERAAARISAAFRRQDGFVDRPLAEDETDKTGEEGSFVGRAKFLWQSDRTELFISADYTRIDADANIAVVPELDPAGLALLWNIFVGFPQGTPLTPEFAAPDLRTSFGTGSPALDFDGGGVSLRIDHDFGAIRARSITAYRTFDSRNQRDNDGTLVDFGQIDYRDEQWQISQEFNLFGTAFDRLNYTAGLYYFHEEADSAWTVFLAPGLFEAFEALPGPVFPLVPGVMCPPPPDMFAPCAGGAGNPLNVNFDIPGTLTPQIESSSYAAFLELEWNFTEKLAAFFGGRLTYDEKDYTYFQSRFLTGIPVVPETSTSDDWTDVSPRAGLTYTPREGLLFYGSFSSGYKAGGYNARPVNPEVARRPFDTEKLWAYELGIKSDLFDNRLRVNAAGFYYDYRDIQLQANDLIGAQTVQVIDNVGEAEILGFEIDATFVLAPGLTLFGSLGYLDAEYEETQEEITGVSLDTKLPKTPEWSASAAIEYAVATRRGDFLARFDYSYVDESFADVRNTPGLRQEAHSLLNARVSYTTPSGRWELAAYGKNLSDESFVLNGFDLTAISGSVIVIPNEPRELGVQMIARF